MRNLVLVAALLLALVIIAPTLEDRPAEAGAQLTGHANVLSGDMLEIDGQRIKLFGIHAPGLTEVCKVENIRSECGGHVSVLLAGHIGQRVVRCDQQGMSNDNAWLAICFLGNEDLNAWMVVHGHAAADRAISERYVKEEAEAKSNHRDLWLWPHYFEYE